MKQPNKWERGNGTTIFGVFVMMLALVVSMVLIQTFSIQQKKHSAQAAADSIADATAVYASNEGANYQEALDYAENLQQMIANETGNETMELKIDKDLFEKEKQVSVTLGKPGTYIMQEEDSIRFEPKEYVARASAITEYTGFTGNVDYVQWMLETAADDTIGYSQPHRYLNPDVDCSSFVFYALQACGYPLEGYPFTTHDMGIILKRMGFQEIPYTSQDELQEGDILWKKGHTEVYAGEGMRVGAHSDENGSIAGTLGGDQTGREVSAEPMHDDWELYYRH